MKKVLYVATVVKTHIMQFHIPYLKLLKDMGYETAVAARNDYEDPGDCVIPYCDRYYDIPFERQPWKRSNIKAYKLLHEIIEREGFDIIHCHTPMGGVIGRLSARGARAHGAKVIYTAHGFHFYDGAPMLNWLLYYPVEKLMSRYTDVLITINREDYDRACSKFHAGKTVFVPGVGIDRERFRADPKLRLQKRRELGIADDEYVILNVGELIPRKNQECIIRAFGRLCEDGCDKKSRLLIAGRGRLEAYLKQLSRETGVEDRVELLGYRDDIEGLMNACDLFVFMSRQEGLPVALMEAMSCGCPVICSDIRGNHDLVEDGVDGRCIPLDKSDPEYLSRVIREIMDNRDIALGYGKKALEAVRGYDIKNLTEMVSKYYHSREEYPVLPGRGYNKSLTVGVSFPDCDKASGRMRTDLQRKAAKAAANLAPIPQGAELNEMKILTIVVPSYNTSAYMRQNIATMLDDRINDSIEILIVDDGSSDETYTIAKSLEESHPGVIKLISKENGGHGSVINVGIREACGRYFKVVDGDDWVDTEGLFFLVEKIKGLKSDPDVIQNPYVEVNQRTGKRQLFKKSVKSGEIGAISDAMDALRPVKIHGLTFRTGLLRENAISLTEKCYYDDFEYALFPLIYARTYIYYDFVVYDYLIGQKDQSVSAESAYKNVGMSYRILEDSLAYLSEREERISALRDTSMGRYIDWSIKNYAKSVYNIFLRNIKKEEAHGRMLEYDADLRGLSDELYRDVAAAYPYIGILRRGKKGEALLLGKLLQLYKLVRGLE